MWVLMTRRTAAVASDIAAAACAPSPALIAWSTRSRWQSAALRPAAVWPMRERT